MLRWQTSRKRVALFYAFAIGVLPCYVDFMPATLAPESVIVRDPSVCGGQPLRHWQTHIRDGLGRADDIEVWKRAKNDGYCIVSKDSDYYNLSVLYG